MFVMCFASVYITYTLIYRDISILYFFSLSCFPSLLVSGLLGFADVCKICAKLVYGNNMYVFTKFSIFEQIF